ncbi:hypothetical protein BZA77DRAFT_93055 [Pyronema omphalodes]|nr:hypothetical protein BZA77DRAFT_93055 [Pyronema omphalodes]
MPGGPPSFITEEVELEVIERELEEVVGAAEAMDEGDTDEEDIEEVIRESVADEEVVKVDLVQPGEEFVDQQFEEPVEAPINEKAEVTVELIRGEELAKRIQGISYASTEADELEDLVSPISSRSARIGRQRRETNTTIATTTASGFSSERNTFMASNPSTAATSPINSVNNSARNSRNIQTPSLAPRDSRRNTMMARARLGNLWGNRDENGEKRDSQIQQREPDSIWFVLAVPTTVGTLVAFPLWRHHSF